MLARGTVTRHVAIAFVADTLAPAPVAVAVAAVGRTCVIDVRVGVGVPRLAVVIAIRAAGDRGADQRAGRDTGGDARTPTPTAMMTAPLRRCTRGAGRGDCKH